MAHKNKKGYGKFYFSHRKTLRAPQASWVINKGPIPKGLHVLHKCDNPGCVNPSHLFLGTNLDNVRDQVLLIIHSSLSPKELSSRLEVGLSQISRIRSGQRWGWIRDEEKPS